jgi:glycerophosphoryl diester phosphodiesterase
MSLSQHPLVFGHRGASAYAPMNTLPAFQLAAEQGAGGIEFDVWLSKDGVPIILHDMHVDATTDGQGRVADMPLAELQALDAGAWKDARYAGTRIPTLDALFAAVGQRFSMLNVEIKSEEGMIEGVEGAVNACIRRHNVAERVIISSFDPRILQRMSGIAPDLRLAFLEYPATPPEAYSLMNLVKHVARHPHATQVNAEYMRRARDNGWQVNVWTVNEVAEAKRLRDLGVDGIFTDYPDVMLRELGAR